ncbi:MAG: hypothetical protein QNJ60_14585 [Xenococcaceae cyanobacterium MO_188.B19]|nr:hypothetical protein [Xenococcaceae cyanobacterium MO_188.B19]
MTGIHYKKLGKSKPVRIPSDAEQWCKEIVRILDTKENPQQLMELLKMIAEQAK